jgi:hypothetical protein
VKVQPEKKSSTNEYFSSICILSTMKNERLLGSDLNKFGKDTNKKVLSKIDLSSPIDKPDQQDSTMFFVTIKSDILQLMLLLCL